MILGTHCNKDIKNPNGNFTNIIGNTRSLSNNKTKTTNKSNEIFNIEENKEIENKMINFKNLNINHHEDSSNFNCKKKKCVSVKEGKLIYYIFNLFSRKP